MLLGHKGICKRLSFPPKLNSYELKLLDVSLTKVICRYKRAMDWYESNLKEATRGMVMLKKFNTPTYYERLGDCA